MSFVDIRARLLKCSTLSLNSEEIWKLRLHRKRLRHTFLSCDWAVVLPFDSIHPSTLVVQCLMLYSFSSASINSCFPLLYRCNSSDCTSGSELIKNTGDSAQYCSQSPSLLTQSTRDFSANVVHALCCNLNFVHLCRSHITLRFQTERVCHVSVWKTVSVAIAQRMHDKYYYSTSCPRTHIRLSHCVLSLRQTRGRLLRPFLFFLCKLMASPVIRWWGCYRIFALLL